MSDSLTSRLLFASMVLTIVGSIYVGAQAHALAQQVERGYWPALDPELTHRALAASVQNDTGCSETLDSP